MATENSLMLLNLAVRHLEPGEVHVEIGTWQGLSLAGALAGNRAAKAYACDDFSEFGGPRTELHRNICDYTDPGQVKFYEMGYREFLGAAPWLPARVGSYYYDGGHTFEEQFLALKLMLPHLADRAIVVVDDANIIRVRAANRLVRLGNRITPVLDIRTPGNCSPTWWNGVQAFAYASNTRRNLSDCRAGIHTSTVSAFERRLLPRVDAALDAVGRLPGLRAAYREIVRIRRA
jgi:hypothetical protein